MKPYPNKRQTLKFLINHFFFCFFVGCIYINSAKSQINADNTLPSNTLVTRSGINFEINGGTVRGSNLFHSFDKFSLKTNSKALFLNNPNISNIITRVTGSSVSNIDGIIQANNSANFFLINPNGLVFGPNSSLLVGGSFFASSASAINFNDGFSFSSNNTSKEVQLTVSQPISFEIYPNNGGIKLFGNGHALSLLDPNFSPLTRLNASTGLQVKPNNTIALIGGDIDIRGQTIRADFGHIELSSIRSGTVSFKTISNKRLFDYSDIKEFGDINLFNKSLLDSNAGRIYIHGNNISIADGSVVLIQNLSNQVSGSINVNATGLLSILGTSNNPVITSSIVNETLVGLGGDININVNSSLLKDGGQIYTRTFSNARSGDIFVKSNETIEIIGFSKFDPSVTSNILANAGLGSSGDTGNVDIHTGSLAIFDGGLVASATLGSGTSGNVTINAADSVIVKGIENTTLQPSAIGSSTLSFGDSGNLTINTKKLFVTDGGRIDASTFTSGNAGNLVINASESVLVSGRVPGSLNPSSILSSANLLDESLQQLFGLPERPSGNSGSLTINTPSLVVDDGAQVSVRHDGTGNAGFLRINANSILIRNNGSISASTLSGQGGNIDLDINNLLFLRNNSSISSSAGNLGSSGDGGNISINTKLLVALENSDITANAFTGNGGRIQITTLGIFQSPDSDITASSQAGGVDGVVEINNPEVDPSDSLTKLPESVDPIEKVAKGCPSGQPIGGSSFTHTGRGGLPQNPAAALSGEAVWQDFRTRQVQATEQPVGQAMPQRTSEVSTSGQSKWVEAKGWQRLPDGKVRLVAHAVNHHNLPPTVSC